MNILHNTVKIIVERTGKEYDSFEDWGLYLINDDYIGSPVQLTNYIAIPGRNTKIDLSEAVVGRITYSNRPISIKLGGNNNRNSWPTIMSSLRNKINGQVCKFIFSNDPSYFWKGRVDITDYALDLSIGTFTIDVPEADPYKYKLQEFNEDWLWDTFNFETDYVTEATEYTITGHTEVTIPAGEMPVSPTIIVTNINTFLTIQKYGDARVVNLSLGENKIYSITINDDSESILMFEGNGKFSINFRGGSL